nr:class I adenylate-forming enzyme family protein [Crateriforma conspicua]
MSLRDQLRNVDPCRRLWTTQDGGTYTANRLLDELNTAGETLNRLPRRVAIVATSSLDLAWLLLVLDGALEQISIVPSGVDQTTRNRLLKSSGANGVICCENTPVTESFPAVRLKSINSTNPIAVGKLGKSSAEFAMGSPQRDATKRTGQATRWQMCTSGTSGPRKWVSHTLRSLTKSLKRNTEAGAKFRWASIYDLSSFAGLQVFLQSWYAGSELLMVDHQEPIQDRVNFLADSGCNAVSATPSTWRVLLMSTAIASLRLKQVTLGGEPADQLILDTLQRTFPDSRVTHIYASTEAGVGFAISDTREGFPASYLHTPPRGLELCVSSNSTLLIRPECFDQHYAGSKRPIQNADGFIDSGDLVRRQADRFVFCGRADGVINVGGRKVHPFEVESCLLRHDSVSMAHVFARRSPIVGSLVQAHVVLRTGVGPTREIKTSLMNHCRGHLQPHQVPASLRIVDSLQLSNNGKLRRATRESSDPKTFTTVSN